MKLENNLFTLITEDKGLLEICMNYAINYNGTMPEARVKRAYHLKKSRRDVAHPRWEQDEINILLDNPTLTPWELRTKLPRHTKPAINSMKYKVKHEKFQNPRIKILVANHKNKITNKSY
jgi:hypothetical protein